MRFVPLLFAALLSFLALDAAAQRAPSQDVDRIVAVVNNEAITLYELRFRITSVERNLRGQGTPLPPRDELEKQILERMIIDRIQMQFGAENGVKIGDAELDAAMRRIAEGNKMALPDFKAVIEKDGISWTKFREEIRQEITISRLRDREVVSKITISEGEIDNYLTSAEASGQTAEYAIAHIIIRLPEQASSEQIARLRSRAEQALALLKNGEDFGKIAASYSDAQDALQGGQIGVRTLDRLPALYADEVQKLQPGGLSDVLRSAAGFHIIKLVDKRGGKIVATAVQQTHARHILIKTNEVVSDAEAKRKIQSLKERLDNGADFAELARLHSNDLSAAKGGDLGWLNKGDTVPEFERVMDSLPLNKTSDPVQSPFGWHLIQVLERRTSEGGKERLRFAARQALLDRKSDEAYQDWLRQMRDRAYVEYRLEER